MKFKLVSEIPLKRAPTSISYFGDNLYVSTKSNRVFYFPPGLNLQKSIVFKTQVNFLHSANGILYCGCTDGKIFGIKEDHKTVFKTHSDNSPITYCKFDKITDKLIVSNTKSKIFTFNEFGLTQNTFYCQTMPITCFDTNSVALLCATEQNNKQLTFIELIDSTQFNLKIKYGFPESILFISDTSFIVGTTNGHIHLYNKYKNNFKLTNTHTVSGGIESLFLINKNSFIVGLSNCTFLVFDIINNKIALTDSYKTNGIPIQFCNYKNKIAVIVSREPRLGRWNHQKKGKNQMLLFEFL